MFKEAYYKYFQLITGVICCLLLPWEPSGLGVVSSEVTKSHPKGDDVRGFFVRGDPHLRW